MNLSTPGTLAVTRRVLRGLTVLNLLYGLGVLAILVASVIAPEPVFRALGFRPSNAGPVPATALRLIALVGLAAVPIAHVILQRLTAMVDTVRSGDPFLQENAHRLAAIGWMVLALEVLRIAVAAIATRTPQLDVGYSFSVTPWLAVLLLFVLARVFDHGARMRSDLEGTV